MTPLLSAGFSMIATSVLACICFGVAFQASRVFHLAAGANILVALYFGLFLAGRGISPLVLIVLLIAIGGTFGAAVEVLVYRKLDKLSVPASRVVIASLGLLVACQALVALMFGTELKTLTTVPSANILLVLHSGVVFAGVTAAVVIPQLRMHKLLVAVGENPELASGLGLSTERVRLLAFVVSGGIAGLLAAVILFGVGAKPEYGLHYVLLGSVGALVVGSHSVRSWVAGGVALGLFRLLALYTLPNSAYVDLATFGLLLALLLFRAKGYFVGSAKGGVRR